MSTNTNTTKQLHLFSYLVNPVDATIERNAMKFYTERVFSIAMPLVQRYYKQYFLVYWRGSFILSQSDGTGGFITRKSMLTNKLVQYKIVYKAPLTRGKILSTLDNQFALSFREPLQEFGIQPMVIVSFSNKLEKRKL